MMQTTDFLESYNHDELNRSTTSQVSSAALPNLVLHFHSLHVLNNTNDVQLSNHIIQLYWKYKMQKSISIQHALAQKAIILLSKVQSDNEDGGMFSSSEEIFNLLSLILDHETNAMCIKAALLEKWTELLQLRSVQALKKASILSLKMIPVNVSEPKNPLKQLIESIQRLANRGLNKNLVNIMEGLQMLADSTTSDEEPFLFYSSTKQGYGDSHALEYDRLDRNARFFFRLIINGNLACTSPILSMDPSNGYVNFNLKHYVRVNDTAPHISVEIFKSFNTRPALHICSISVTYPIPRVDLSMSGSISTHLLPPISLWYHFKGSGRRMDYSGYLGLTSFYTISSIHQLPCNLDFLDRKTPSIVQEQLISTPARVPSSLVITQPLDGLFSFRDRISGRSFIDHYAVAEPKRHSLIRVRSQKFPVSVCSKVTQIPLDESYLDDSTTESLVTHWKSMLQSLSAERPLAPKEALTTSLQLYSRCKGENFDEGLTVLQASDIIFDAADTRIIGDLSFLWLQQFIYPSKRRPLYPTESKIRKLSTINFERPSLIITIVAVRNIPHRSYNDIRIEQPTLRSPSRSSFIDSKSGENDNVMSMIQVQFRGKKHFSQIVSRTSPYFKQTLVISLLMDDETLFTPKCLSESEEIIEMKLFDVFDIESNGGRDHHFLGELNIPLKCLYGTSKIEGTFKLETPEILIGYMKTNGFVGDEAYDAPAIFKTPSRVLEESSPYLYEAYENIDKSTYLDVAVNIYPSITHGIQRIEAVSIDKFPREDPRLLIAIKHWMQACQMGDNRWIQLAALDLEGNQWILPRYLRRLAPPHSVRKSMRQCSHFVSLISDRGRVDLLRLFFSGRVSSCQQCIDLQCGDEIEHAILLCNYFLYLNKKRRDRCDCKVFLVFGQSHLNERIVLVGTLMKDSKFLLWDAVKGDVYSVTKDTWYPIVDIINLVTETNMYINLQRSLSINELSFDVSKKKNWSCFASPSGKRWPSIQNSSINYSPLDYKLAAQLESEIGRAVRQSLPLWRGRMCTIRDDVSDRLVGILEELEDIKLNGSNFDQGYFTSISSLIEDREIFGFPLHSAYTNVKDILRKIEMTEIHKTAHPHCEFAVTVRVFPYENNIMSVWVFICRLSPVVSSVEPTRDCSFSLKA